MVVDDYGHHPTEIAAVIAAARAGIDRRVVVVFQPHRYSRTEPADATSSARRSARADEVVLTDIYAAGEAPIPGMTVEALADAVRAARVVPGARRQGARRRCRRRSRPGAARRPRDHARRRLDRHRRRPDPRGDPRARRGREGPAMSVKAPTEKNFRRARVKPAKREGRARLDLVARRVAPSCAAAAGASTPATAPSISSSAPRRCRCSGSPCTATSGCRPARCRRWSTACAARAS